MTEGDNNVSNVKMHSSQRNGHPTKTKKLTDQTAHSCPSQTDDAKKRTPTDSVWYCSHLSTGALPTHSHRQKAQIKTSMAGATSLKKEKRQKVDEVKEFLLKRKGESMERG